MFERNQNNKKRFSLAEIVTLHKSGEPNQPDNRIFFRKTMQHHSLYPSTTANLQHEPDEQKGQPEIPFTNFKNKLLNFLKNNEQHAKNATKYFQRMGGKTHLWLKTKNKKNKIQTEPSGHSSDKEKKRKSIKQYMAEASLQKRKKYDNQSSQSMDITPRNQTEEEKKSHSVLIVRKVDNNKRDVFEREFADLKTPIHHTQSYFFQKHKPKTQHRFINESKIQSLKNSKSMKPNNQGGLSFKYDELKKYYSSFSQSRIAQSRFTISTPNQNDHNFIKRRRKIPSKVSRNSHEYFKNKNKTEAVEEGIDGDIGPWKRRITMDSELP